MNFLEIWVQGAAAKALGETLLHSLWEGAAVALALAMVLSVVRSSRVRYAAACLAMIVILAGFGTTFSRLMPHGEGRASVPMLPASVSSFSDDRPIVIAHAWEAADLLPWLAPLWMVGVALFQLRCLASWVAATRLRRIGVCAAPDEWFERLDALRLRLRMTRPVTLLESCLAEVPAVMGHLRPVILVPVGLLAGLPTAQVEAILLHELAHIRRGDYLMNLMQTVVEGLLFYNPAVWWISTVIRTERENCCDDVVVATSGDAHEYATALAALATSGWAVGETALAATGGNLVKRIRRLLAQPEGSRTALAPMLSAGILVVTCGVALAAWQSPRQNAPVVPESAIKSEQPQTAAPVTSPEPSAKPQTKDLEQPRGMLGVNKPEQPRTAPPVTSAEPAAKFPTKDLTKALGQLRETLGRIEGKRGSSMLLAQDTGTAAPVSDSYRKWLEEVSYIITNEERKVFKSLRTDEDRDSFIKQFWLHRDPAAPRGARPEEYPTILHGDSENEFKKEFYRRIAYANDRFADKKVAGWKTDRGRIYIEYGPPDEIDSHPSVGTYTRPPEEGGGQSFTYPFEQWRYKYIDGIGKNIIIEFVDTTRTGEYRMTMDPNEKDASLYVPKAGLTTFRLLGGPQGIVEITLERKMVVTLPIAFAANQYLITVSTVSSDGKANLGSSQVLANSCKTAPANSGCLIDSWRTIGSTALPPGSYTVTAVVKDTAGSTQKTYVVNFAVD
jgi:GWxTD domain-containing protein